MARGGFVRAFPASVPIPCVSAERVRYARCEAGVSPQPSITTSGKSAIYSEGEPGESGVQGTTRSHVRDRQGTFSNAGETTATPDYRLAWSPLSSRNEHASGRIPRHPILGQFCAMTFSKRRRYGWVSSAGLERARLSLRVEQSPSVRLFLPSPVKRSLSIILNRSRLATTPDTRKWGEITGGVRSPLRLAARWDHSEMTRWQTLELEIFMRSPHGKGRGNCSMVG